MTRFWCSGNQCKLLTWTVKQVAACKWMVLHLLVFVATAGITPTSAQSLNPEVIWAMPNSARIKCVTTTPGKMTVEYGRTPALGMSSTPEMRDWPDTDVTRHYVILKGLQPDTQYYYRVRVALQSGGELVSDKKTFRTFRAFSHVLPTVHYSSYIIGSGWSANDTNAPYHNWNAAHYDLNIAYAPENAGTLKQYNPNAVCLTYDNITNAYAAAWHDKNEQWMNWADQQGISYEHIALHYAIDTKVNLRADPIERVFETTASSWNYGVQRLSYNNYYLPNKVGWFLVIGRALRFDIVYVNLSTPATGGYNGVWEYCNGVDAEGKPSSWAPLTIVQDTTEVNGTKFAQNGYVRFIPPKERTEWVRARSWTVNDFTEPWKRLFLIRFRVTQVASNSPRLVQNKQCLLDEDFVTRTADNYWIVPGWDRSWEGNPENNGDPEYNPNPPSSGGYGVAKSARFKWWSRIWYYRADLLRFLCNVFDPYYQQWATGPWLTDMMSVSGVDGWYCDNYGPKTSPETALDPAETQTVELGVFNITSYSKQFSEVLEQTSIELTKIGKLSSANNFFFLTPTDDWTANHASSDPDIMWQYFAPGIANREISMTINNYYYGHGRYSTLNTLFAEAALWADRGRYAVPIYTYTTATKSATNTQEWWYREKTFALAEYLLIKDVHNEYLYLNAWHQNFYYGEYLTDNSGNIYYITGIPKQKAYYVDAAAYDFGQPITTVPPGYTQWTAYPGSWRPGTIPGLFVIYYTDRAPSYDSNGNFTGNTSKAWYFARRYTKALVVLRTGDFTVKDDRSMNEYTAFDLDGYFYRLLADGTLDATPINRLNLRHQEAAILIPTDQPPPSNPDVQVSISVDKTNPKPLDVVTVSITARNLGNAEARDVRVQHNIPSEATYVLGSLKVNGVAVADPADTTKIDVTIPSVPAGGQATVQFQMVIR